MIKLLVLIGFALSAEAPMDSVGVETVNGKIFVIHRVDEKETLFAISKRYRTTVDAILQYNKDADLGLELGQILKVPYVAPTKTARPTDGTVHEVVSKETMFSISKKYGVTVDEIKQWNNLSDNSLSIGQQLVIKKKGNSSAASVPLTKELPTQSSTKGVHTIAASETLFSISRQYNVSVDQLKKWNNLENNDVQIGQMLMVAEPERGMIAKREPETSTTPVVKKDPPVDNSNTNSQPEKKEPVVTTAPVKSEPVKTEPKTEPPVQTQTIRISESVKNGSENIEAGVAELIEGTEGNRKYLALHRTAPVGTILKVRNEMNNREVFVRVMGKLPDTALTDKVIIRISKSAYDRLGAIDQRFRVEVTYYK
jgi:LysM repeat protein